MTDPILTAMRDVIQVDVGQRGLRTDPNDNLISAWPSDFEGACRSLADLPDPSVCIVTGFFIPTGDPPCGETDGPLGAVFLARALVPLGCKVAIASDAFCLPALVAGLAVCGLEEKVSVATLPGVDEAAALTPVELARRISLQTGVLTHLIALERVGPSHTYSSIRFRGEPAETFLDEVPLGRHDRCHTMRGRDITSLMSPAHFLFEARFCFGDHVETIGIGDGGNEIGMGKIAWEVIRRNIPNGGVVACRVPTDRLIVAGVSNWGAYGLGAGVLRLRGQKPTSDLFDPARELTILERMVEHGPLVDGVTGKKTATVDGLPFDRYAKPLEELGRLLAS